MKRALRILLGDRPIAYHPLLARVMGSAAGGIWLSQILYWDSAKLMSYDSEGESWDGWFYKSEPDIIGETALTRRECQTAKTRARELGLVETQVKGVPPTSHYRVDFECLEKLIEQAEKPARSIAHHRAVNRTPSRGQSVQSHAQIRPQITTEITTEINTSASTPDALPPIESDPPKSPELPKQPTAQQSMMSALSEVTHQPIAPNAGKLGKCAANLLRVEGVTGDRIREWYAGDLCWWVVNDWRGKQGQAPNIAAINETVTMARDNVAGARPNNHNAGNGNGHSPVLTSSGRNLGI